MKNKEVRTQIIYWAKKFGIKNLYIERDDYMSYAGCVDLISDKKQIPILRYNIPLLKEYGQDYLSVIFHELGHIKYKTYTWDKLTIKEKVQGEYLAERFSYNKMKKYFPKKIKSFVKRQLTLIYSDDWAEEWPIHTEAFRKVYKQ